jgi:hypothetical protein
VIPVGRGRFDDVLTRRTLDDIEYEIEEHWGSTFAKLRTRSSMGFFFRKSISYGPLRLNFSKAGIGTSIGVKGFRITSTARGTTNYTAGIGGFYYRETLNFHNRAPVESSNHFAADADSSSPNFSTADPEVLMDSSTENLVKALTERSQRYNPAFLVYAVVVVGLLVLLGGAETPIQAGAIWTLAVIGIALGIYLHMRHSQECQTTLTYTLNEHDLTALESVQKAVGHLRSSHRLWRILDERETWDQRRNSGASTIIKRATATVGLSRIPRVESNIPVMAISMADAHLFFLPDVVLYRHLGRFGAIQYPDLTFASGESRYIETESRPRDAVQVGTTWRFARVDGGPDRRFNNNHPIPIFQYGTIRITSRQGLNLYFHTSSVQAARLFAGIMNRRCRGGTQSESNREESRRFRTAPSPLTDDITAALNVLELTGTPSLAEISAGFRRQAALYHPDKVAALGPELQSLAEKKMKEINAAYSLLRSHFS